MPPGQQISEEWIAFSKRMRHRRHELQMTRRQLQLKIVDMVREKVSMETLRNMKRDNPAYTLPRRRYSERKPPIECVAMALGVPLGYLLGGFPASELSQSCFSTQIQNGNICLTNSLRPKAEHKRLADFTASLPDTERELLQLPLHSYRNERAFAIIFRIEKIFAGLGMLIVNEPPLIFWDEEDVDLWSLNMNLDDVDCATFRTEFMQYGDYFRHLARTGKKEISRGVESSDIHRLAASKVEGKAVGGVSPN